MDKSKRKRKPGQPGWLSSLFAPATIDFIAYLPLEECSARLQSREKTGFWRSPKTYVELASADADTTSFRITRTGSKYGTFIAEGYLERWEGTYTHISGEVGSNPKDYVILIILLALVLGLLSLAIRDFDVVAVVVIFFMGAFGFLSIGILAERRYGLAEMIEETMGY